MADTLQAFADKHANDLFNLVALLAAAAERIDAATPPTTENMERHEDMHNTLRLVQMAGDKAKVLAELLFAAG